MSAVPPAFATDVANPPTDQTAKVGARYLGRGVVLLRGAFDSTELEAAVDDAFARGERRTPQGAVQTGWYADATSKELNYGTQRGRVYDRLETYGSNLVALGQKALRLAQDAD